MIDIFITRLVDAGLNETGAELIVRLGGLAVLLVLAVLLDWIVRSILIKLMHNFAKFTRTVWDDIFVKRKVFNRLSHFAPAVLIYRAAPAILAGYDGGIAFVHISVKVYMAIIAILVIDSLLNSILDIYRTFEVSYKVPIRGFIQAVKLVVFSLGFIAIISLVLKRDPLTILGGLGALTAVLMLIFKDSILGLAAGIQISANQMVRIGDWIEMPKYGADGDVIDITLTTVKVRNWDKTISTVPAYALVTDSFKNWRGMSESGGRRIKRSLYIDMRSIKFCDEKMLEKFRKIQYISEYIDRKKEEISEFNRARSIDDSVLVNGRRMTNIGTFRAYITAYLRNHPNIHQSMTFLVRHLEPTPKGLPIQIYVFSSDQVWANYEAIQADIFDHILAVVDQFDLRVFQEPSGADISQAASVLIDSRN